MTQEAKFRQLPSVDYLLFEKHIQKLCETFPRELVVDLIRQKLAEIRQSISQNGLAPPSDEEISKSVVMKALSLGNTSLRPVVNATGIILHTNLGRAPLSPEAVEAMELASRGYCNLEFDLDSGKRGSRQAHVEQLLCQLTHAEAALVVNNNASGVLLALSALASGSEIIVSRGQAVEIGGGFRIPDVMYQSGVSLVEVGTTNRTSLCDYEQAITSRTVALLRVHSSNFKIIGFTSSVSLEELVELGRQHDLPVIDDIGSGCFVDTTRFGLDAEPQVQNSISAGAALVFFSGDKLLGGPQAGIIVGREEFVAKLRKHPLARAARIDKIRLAGLAATLVHYLRGEALEKIPTLRLIATPLSEIEQRAERWVQYLGNSASIIQGESLVGGGSIPGSTLPTQLVVIKLRTEVESRELARKLRQYQPPIIGRVEKKSLILDPRCVFLEEEEGMLEVVRDAIATLSV